MARQFKWSVEADNAFAPTSLSAIPRMLLHMACMSNGEFEVATADVKDAFLMVPQPEDEKVAIMCGGKSYKLMRCLPGQER